MKKECFSTKKLDWEIGADWEFKWKSSINQYVEAFLKTEIPGEIMMKIFKRKVLVDFRILILDITIHYLNHHRRMARLM